MSASGFSFDGHEPLTEVLDEDREAARLWLDDDGFAAARDAARAQLLRVVSRLEREHLDDMGRVELTVASHNYGFPCRDFEQKLERLARTHARRRQSAAKQEEATDELMLALFGGTGRE